MNQEKLIEEIKDIILDLYEACFVGDMKIEKVDDGYILNMYTNKDWLTPTIKLYVQCSSEEEFLCKVREDLHHRQLHLNNYFTGEKLKFNDYKKRRFEAK